MADLTTTLKGVAISQSAANAVAALSGDAAGMVAQAQIKAADLIRLLNALGSALPANDANLPTINSMIAALVTLGKLDFTNTAQSAHAMTAWVCL